MINGVWVMLHSAGVMAVQCVCVTEDRPGVLPSIHMALFDDQQVLLGHATNHSWYNCRYGGGRRGGV